MDVIIGGTAPSLKEQGFDDEDGHLQKDVDAIIRLVARGIITGKERTNAEKRLVRKLKPLGCRND